MGALLLFVLEPVVVPLLFVLEEVVVLVVVADEEGLGDEAGAGEVEDVDDDFKMDFGAGAFREEVTTTVGVVVTLGVDAAFVGAVLVDALALVEVAGLVVVVVVVGLLLPVVPPLLVLPLLPLAGVWPAVGRTTFVRRDLPSSRQLWALASWRAW